MTDRVCLKSEFEQSSYRIRDSEERPMIHMKFHINDKMQQHIYLSLEEAKEVSDQLKEALNG